MYRILPGLVFGLIFGLLPLAVAATSDPPLTPGAGALPQLAEDQALALPRGRDRAGLTADALTSFKGAVEAYGAGDYEVARSLWEQLSQLGFAPAQHNLGVMYEHGRGGPVDVRAAVKWYAKAGAAEVPAALLNLARLHLQGHGVRRDPARALELLERAAQLGYAPAQYNLGIAYLQGSGVEADAEEAAEWFEAAAEQGHAPARYNLAGLYLHGEGVDKDTDEAARLFGLAADAGDAMAHYALGVLHYRAKRLQRAATYINTAAEAGITTAQAHWAFMLAKGHGVGRDPEAAFMWFVIASAMGNKAAAGNRDALSKILSADKRAAAERRARQFRPRNPVPVSATTAEPAAVALTLEPSKN